MSKVGLVDSRVTLAPRETRIKPLGPGYELVFKL